MSEALFYVASDDKLCADLIVRGYPFFDTSNLDIGDGLLEFSRRNDSTLIFVRNVDSLLERQDVYSAEELFFVLSHPTIYKLYANRSYGDIRKFLTTKLRELR